MEKLIGQIDGNEFKSQELAMLANGASKCGAGLCQKIMENLIVQIDEKKFNAIC